MTGRRMQQKKGTRTDSLVEAITREDDDTNAMDPNENVIARITGKDTGSDPATAVAPPQ